MLYMATYDRGVGWCVHVCLDRTVKVLS